MATIVGWCRVLLTLVSQPSETSVLACIYDLNKTTYNYSNSDPFTKQICRAHYKYRGEIGKRKVVSATYKYARSRSPKNFSNFPDRSFRICHIYISNSNAQHNV
jgi:hypothetical protein